MYNAVKPINCQKFGFLPHTIPPSFPSLYVITCRCNVLPPNTVRLSFPSLDKIIVLLAFQLNYKLFFIDYVSFKI